MKNKRKKSKNVYLPLLLLTTVFLCVAYAQIGDVTFSIDGLAQAYTQEGVFITDVTYKSSTNSDSTNSTINLTTRTMIDSQIVLGTTADASITYQVDVYNNTDKDYVFIGVLTDETDNTLYSNSNIEVVLEDIEQYTTTISPKTTLQYTITFKYKDGADITQNTLSSKLNFRFQEVPTLILSNEGEKYTLNNVYPDYTPQEYTFTVSNYDNTEINNVPMTYYFETNVESPFTIKIYDDSGNEVANGINIQGDNYQQVTHTYTLKLIWDNSNPVENIAYNSFDNYADKDFQYNIILKAIPDSEKYLDYAITKEFTLDINTSYLKFNVDINRDIQVEKTSSSETLTITNYSSSTEYNNFDVGYEISLTGNDKFTVTIDNNSPVNNVFSKTLTGGSAISNSFTIKFAADINNLDLTENITLNISIKSPYVKEVSIPLTLSLQPVTVTLNANGGSTSPSSITVYKGKTYADLPTPTWDWHTFNGWYTSASGGTKISSSTEVTTSSQTQTLYAQWTSHLLVDYVSTGDYVAYDINYNNVYTKNGGTHYASLTGWRVLDTQIDENGDEYVRLITAGVPMAYRHAATSTTSGQTSAANLTTNFFSTAISSSSANNSFNACGFQNDLGTIITIGTLKNLFANNKYTQVSNGTPKVQSITNEDIESVLNITVSNEKDIRGNDLFAIPSSDQSSEYASYYLATSASSFIYGYLIIQDILYTLMHIWE